MCQGEPKTMAIKTIVDDFGYFCKVCGGTPKENAISCYKTLYNALDSIGESGLKRILGVTSSAWPRNSKAIESSILMGLTSLYELFAKQIDDRILARKLASHTPQQVVQAAANTVGALLGGARGPAIAAVMVEIYNHRTVKTKKLLKNK